METEGTRPSRDSEAAKSTSGPQPQEVVVDVDNDTASSAAGSRDVDDEALDTGEGTADSARIPNDFIGQRLQGHNVLGNPIFNSAVYFGDQSRLLVQTLDRTDEAQSIAKTFLDTDVSQKFSSAVVNSPVSVIFGERNSGRHSQALVGLARAGCAQVVEILQTDVLQELLDGVMQVVREARDPVGIIAEVGRSLTRRLSRDQVRTIAQTVTRRSAGSRLVLVVGEPPGIDGSREIVFPSSRPPVAAIIAHLSARDGLGTVARENLARLCRLASVETFAAVVQLKNIMEARAGMSDDQILMELTGQTTHKTLKEWFSVSRDVELVSLITAAAVLEGEPEYEVSLRGKRLAEIIRGVDSSSGSSTSIGLVGDSPTDELVEIRTIYRSTHFGELALAAIYLRTPLTSADAIWFLWSNLSVTFRSSFTAWVNELATDPQLGARLGCAVAAGILFAHDPGPVEALLLRPWALSSSSRVAAVAATAVGISGMLTGSSASAARLVKYWVTSGNVRMARTAVIALGGPLGSADITVGAAAILWNLPGLHPDLAREANASLAQIGSSDLGGHARSSVWRLLMSRIDSGMPLEMRRAFEVAALSFGQILEQSRTGSGLLGAPSDGMPSASSSSRNEVLEVVTRCFVAPLGFRSAVSICGAIVTSVDSGHLTEQESFQIVREMKVAARGSNDRAALGSGLRRALHECQRSASWPRNGGGRRLLDQFFGEH